MSTETSNQAPVDQVAESPDRKATTPDPKAATPDQKAASHGEEAPRTSGRATSDVGTLRALVLALPMYGASVLVARAMPRDIRDILLDRGWVCHAIMLLACLAITILLLKAAALRSQRRAFALSLLPEGGERITPDGAAPVIEHLERRRVELAMAKEPKSFLVERLHRVLEHFASRGDAAEAAAVSTAEAEADAAASASSFGVVKILVWAIPILGFIGTVIGISDAVAGFSRSLDGAGQLDTIKTALGDVTTGLAVAFDTTLVALVASILVMMPTSWLQKAEDRLLGDVDDLCVTGLLRRLSDASKEPAKPESAPRDQAVHELVSALTAAALHLGPGLERAIAGVERATAALEGSAKQVVSAGEALSSRVDAERAASAKVRDATGAHVTAVLASSEKVAASLERAAAGVEHAARLAETTSTWATASVERATRQLEEATAGAARTTAAVVSSVERATRHIEESGEVSSRTTAAALAGVERALSQLDAATVLAGKATETTANAQDQLCRELGASRHLLQLLAAGLGAGSPQLASTSARAPNGAGAPNGNGGNGKHAV